MELEIVDQARKVEDLSSGCCTLDVWAIYISDDE